MNLYQKIIKVREVAKGFAQEEQKAGLKYTYVSGNQILAKIKNEMNAQQLILQPSIQLGEHEQYHYTTKYDKAMTDFIVKGKMSYTWINAEKPEEREVIEWAYYGQQSEISKALGSGLTYAERYFLLKYFGLPTDEDDPDGKPETEYKNKNNNNSEKESNSNLSEKQINRLFAIAKGKGYDSADVKKSIKKQLNIEVLETMTKAQYDKVCAGYEKANQKF